MSKDENPLNLMHALILTKLYDALKENGKPIIIELEDGNQEHAETINKLVDEGLISVMPDKNRLLIHLSDDGRKLMQTTEWLEKNIQNQGM